MDYKEAIEILHPDTTEKKLEEIRYSAGFNAYKASINAVNEACIVACEAMEKLQEKFEKESSKPIHIRYRIKSTGRIRHMIYCGKCGEFGKRVSQGDNFCRHCGTPIDWNE